MNISVNGNNNYTAGRDVHIYAPMQNALETKKQERDMAYHLWQHYQAQRKKSLGGQIINRWSVLFVISLCAFALAVYFIAYPILLNTSLPVLFSMARTSSPLQPDFFLLILPAITAAISYSMAGSFIYKQEANAKRLLGLQQQQAEKINQIDSEIEYLKRNIK